MNIKDHMKPIYFDSERRVDYQGYFLFIVGLIAFWLALYGGWQTSKLITKTNVELNHIKSLTISKPPHKVDSDDPERKEIVGKILKEINYPWDKLFSSLEAIHTSDISLMVIQPNIDNKEVLIYAEAISEHLMFEYVRVLGRQKGIDHVELLSHEAGTVTSQEKVNFSIMIKLV